MTDDSPRLRLGILAVVIVSLFAALFARLWFLQVLASPTYRVQAQNNQVRLVQEQAPRGRIFDRQGRVLVDNRVAVVVAADRQELQASRRQREVVDRLAATLGRPVQEIRQRLADKRYSPFQPVPVAEDVAEETVVFIMEHQEDFPGVTVRRVSVREYPYGPLAAHLLGYVGEINGEELDARRQRRTRAQKRYQLGDSIGKSGVERVYEDDLRGEPGLEKLEVDSRGRVLRSLGKQSPEPGADLHLTIDLDIQALAEQALAEQLAQRRRSRVGRSTKLYPAPAGAVVVMDPRNGSVLAMASNPTYDPRQFVNGITPEAFAVLNDPNNHFPLNNRAVQGEYSPGSTFKLISATAGLRTGLITPNTTMVDRGSLRVGNRTFRNAGSRAYGAVALPRAITVSSDVFFYAIGRDFWERRGTYGDAMQSVAGEFGMGQPSGVPLPAEQDGRVPTPEIRAQLYDANPGKYLERNWFAGDNVNLAIGQGELVVTPLQLANAYATFANGGMLHAPNVASKVSGSGGVVRELPPRVVRSVDLPPNVREPILAGLVGVTSRDEGTASHVFAGFPQSTHPVAGKTGTAQAPPKEDTALFVSFAPAYSPQWVVAVVMEQSGFGSSAAAPVARRLLDALAGVTPMPKAQPLAPGAPAAPPPTEPPPTVGEPAGRRVVE